MHIAHNERGTTLVEALVAAGLLITIVSGIAYLIVQAHRFAVRAEQMTVAVVAASARLERLRAIRASHSATCVPSRSERRSENKSSQLGVFRDITNL